MKKLLIITTVVTTCVAAYTYFAFVGSEIALMERFPEVPERDIIRAHRRMFAAALRGELKDVDTNDDVVMDDIFIKHLRAVQNL